MRVNGKRGGYGGTICGSGGTDGGGMKITIIRMHNILYLIRNTIGMCTAHISESKPNVCNQLLCDWNM